ncbi:hypothetical protein TNCV_3256241 [Trichonephila clavipes]|nr:hypothetical protein TNCV_3256241 [Trichonephila clavipes]
MVDFHKRILFSDEAHFWLNGYVKKQNCRIWSEANPQVYVETPLHPETLTVWCALWAGGIIELGSVLKLAPTSTSTTVPSASFPCRLLPFFTPAAKKKKQHFPSHCVFGAPRTRFGAVKPPSCALPFLALVTYFSFVLVRPFSSSSLPLRGVFSDIDSP